MEHDKLVRLLKFLLVTFMSVCSSKGQTLRKCIITKQNFKKDGKTK